MFRNLFQFLFGSFSRRQKDKEQAIQESLLIQRMIQQAEEIADGSYIVDRGFKVQKERRKNKR